MGLDTLTQVLRYIPVMKNDKLLVDMEAGDDTAVHMLNENTAVIHTLDFFTPIVDNPYNYGTISAANALIGIHARHIV